MMTEAGRVSRRPSLLEKMPRARVELLWQRLAVLETRLLRVTTYTSGLCQSLNLEAVGPSCLTMIWHVAEWLLMIVISMALQLMFFDQHDLSKRNDRSK
jgi:hypothetical protein